MTATQAAPIGRERRLDVGVAVDIAPLAIAADDLRVGLVRIRNGPESGRLALPGGRVEADESLDQAALRWLATYMSGAPTHLEQLFTFGAPSRDPTARVISVAYLALLRTPALAPALEWHCCARKPKLGYDHPLVLRLALERLRGKLSYTNIAFGLLPLYFSLGDLQTAYETILGRKLDRRNFRKRVLTPGLLVPARTTRRGPHRPAQLFRFARRGLQTMEILRERPRARPRR